MAAAKRFAVQGALHVVEDMVDLLAGAGVLQVGSPWPSIALKINSTSAVGSWSCSWFSNSRTSVDVMADTTMICSPATMRMRFVTALLLLLQSAQKVLSSKYMYPNMRTRMRMMHVCLVVRLNPLPSMVDPCLLTSRAAPCTRLHVTCGCMLCWQDLMR